MGFFSNIFGAKKQEVVVQLPDLSAAVVDFHSHLIPGIDDGAQTMDDSINLIKGLMGFGFKKIITSPHVMSDGYPNTPEIILKGKDAVRNRLKEEGIEIPFDAAAEYYIDQTVIDAARSRELLTFGNNNVLVELSYLTPPLNLTDWFFRLRSEGYNVVLAHPERYPFYYRKDAEVYEQVKNLGVHFQLNLSSLTGMYGEGARKAAEQLIDAGMIDYVATDLHNARHLEYLRKCLSLPYVEKILNHEFLLNKQLL